MRKVRKSGRLVFGFGVNDSDYPTSKTETVDGKCKVIWRCPFYRKWLSLVERCYSEKCKQTKPLYKNCRMVGSWTYFMTFRSWMMDQDWEGKELDKDLIIPGNKIYGPDTCVFVDSKVNKFLTEANSIRGEWPIGVYFNKRDRKFISRCCDFITGKQIELGRFNNAEEAHQAWLSFKLQQAHILAAEQTDPRVAAALIDRYENYSKYFDQGT